MLDESLRPVPKKDVDYTSLPVNPTPSEFFLLSRVDGRSTVKDLCSLSGMSKQQTLDALSNLRRAGLIEVPGAPTLEPVAAAVSEPVEQQPPTEAMAEPTAVTVASIPKASEKEDVYAYFPVSLEQWGGADASVLSDPSIELEPERRREIMYIHANLDELDHYQLLGLTNDAPRKAVRKAFNRMAKQFHPDLFYGRTMGPLAEQAEAVFLRVNLAQQILSHKKKRAEYDRSQSRARARQEQSAASSASSVSSVSETSESLSHASEAQDNKKREMAVMVLMRRGERYEQAGNWLKAASEYKKAFGLKRDPDVALKSAGLLMRGGHEHIDQAVLLAKAAYKVDPTKIAALMLIGDAYEEAGRLDEAARYYQLILRDHPEHTTATKRLRYLDAQR